MSQETNNLPAPPTVEELANQLKTTMATIQSSHETHSTNTDRSNIPLDQFLLAPLSVHDQVNPRKPILEFDGSNYSIWQAAIDRTIRYVTHQEGPFVSNLSSFSSLPLPETRSIEVVIRNTIDHNLLVILDSRKLQTPKEMCELLTQICQPTDRRHKLNLIENLIKIIQRKRTISEQWIVDWHQIYFEISQLKLSNDEFMGLFFQASLNLPNEVDPTVVDFLTNQRLEKHPNPTFDQVSTVISHILLDLKVKLDKTNTEVEEPIEAEKPEVVDQKKKEKEIEKEEGDGEDEEDEEGDEDEEKESCHERHGSMCDYCQDEVWDNMEDDKEFTSESDSEYVPPNRSHKFVEGKDTQAEKKADGSDKKNEAKKEDVPKANSTTTNTLGLGSSNAPFGGVNAGSWRAPSLFTAANAAHARAASINNNPLGPIAKDLFR
ncbi:hypothetical protein MJO28_016025 [Puccinia striiformis f. sp. tritici]|uniref:Retrotransposon Copia-like N-terminal domain-containing protein n=5 Tax=Puccinia striiformis TaxID=27350 RepID=A0A2S4VTK3_9BASI|nr:hypothetical protein Pst134EA_028955 [Puccinia striiformis f. sp. tritici]KAI9617302.1 hypothetical protein H4Q26_013171 [Puccinia striiformis f. sp. tritici PST-130]KNF05438.1 hypothetical protein PSTG_01246 [Puccinia striiformis f. sp. tritici PST-78]POW00495.1 hypothetical protein PSHT_13015 [Puccinia striiformis]KAH9441007.1 hypothetical protein Pst134EB_029659 [Puccinia striiformis f. sp. tritici]KAH9446970.1 hypothetical protein Pst134EA_028955 [Puccinia striiformis f. sp. tritici]